jgi:signal transduction histidine kinase
MLLHDKNCSIEFTSNGNEIISHPILLTQILTNLVSNAIKYNDKEKPKVSLSFSFEDAAYLINVTDNGPGIPADQFEKIFEPFVIQAAKDRFGNKGHGLGLASVKKAIMALGGSIKVTSIPNEGTTFHITLPRS